MRISVARGSEMTRGSAARTRAVIQTTVEFGSGATSWSILRCSATSIIATPLFPPAFPKESTGSDQQNHRHAEVHGDGRVFSGKQGGEGDDHSNQQAADDGPAQASQTADDSYHESHHGHLNPHVRRSRHHWSGNGPGERRQADAECKTARPDARGVDAQHLYH